MYFCALKWQIFQIKANIKFLTRLSWKPVKIIEALQQIYGESAPCRAVVYNWIKCFKEGREQVEDDSREERPSTSKNRENIRLVQNLVEEDRRVTMDEIINAVGISHKSVFSIFTEDLCLSKLSAHWVPKVLPENQLNQRTLFLALLTKMEANETIFSKCCLTRDQMWIYQFDPENKIQSKEWHPKGAPGPVTFKAQRSVRKVMVTIFRDCEGVILIDFVEGKKTVTSSYYKDILKKLKTSLAKKRSEKLHSQILFHQDNAPAHSSKAVRALLHKF